VGGGKKRGKGTNSSQDTSSSMKALCLLPLLPCTQLHLRRGQKERRRRGGGEGKQMIGISLSDDDFLPKHRLAGTNHFIVLGLKGKEREGEGAECQQQRPVRTSALVKK